MRLMVSTLPLSTWRAWVFVLERRVRARGELRRAVPVALWSAARCNKRWSLPADRRPEALKSCTLKTIETLEPCPLHTLLLGSMMSPWYSRDSQWSLALPWPPSFSSSAPGIVGQPDWARASATTVGVTITLDTLLDRGR